MAAKGKNTTRHIKHNNKHLLAPPGTASSLTNHPRGLHRGRMGDRGRKIILGGGGFHRKGRANYRKRCGGGEDNKERGRGSQAKRKLVLETHLRWKG